MLRWMPPLPLVVIPNCPHPPSSSIHPCPCSIHQWLLSYFNRQRVYVLNYPAASSLMSFCPSILNHIELPMTVMRRILKAPSRGMQLRPPILLISKQMISGMERMLIWKAIRIRARALFQIGIFWPKNLSWRLRNLVSLSILYCILRDSLVFLCSGESSIMKHDLDILRPFAVKIRNNLTAATFNEMAFIFPEAGVQNLAKTRSHVRSLSRFRPVEFACCINSCICYAGPYADLDECPKCTTLRLDGFGRARRKFSYMPLIPRLCALMSNRTYATHL